MLCFFIINLWDFHLRGDYQLSKNQQWSIQQLEFITPVQFSVFEVNIWLKEDRELFSVCANWFWSKVTVVQNQLLWYATKQGFPRFLALLLFWVSPFRYNQLNWSLCQFWLFIWVYQCFFNYTGHFPNELRCLSEKNKIPALVNRLQFIQGFSFVWLNLFKMTWGKSGYFFKLAAQVSYTGVVEQYCNLT